ncbi:tetratricopeptide repeat protein 36 [Platysternon megacephalum]|uniref:Tetratricopeptide repeat protein 36 n=1 Tax=Platysternon megacephalum TaxID=55544 RepID=A0A4D9DYI8_9SAUR|nr:tetratricopeptide repeat protein 36 [Platysternon megacephalum]
MESPNDRWGEQGPKTLFAPPREGQRSRGISANGLTDTPASKLTLHPATDLLGCTQGLSIHLSLSIYDLMCLHGTFSTARPYCTLFHYCLCGLMEIPARPGA